MNDNVLSSEDNRLSYGLLISNALVICTLLAVATFCIILPRGAIVEFLEQQQLVSFWRTYIPVLILATPLIGRILSILIVRERRDARDGFASVFSLLSFCLSLSLYPLVQVEAISLPLFSVIGQTLLLHIDVLSVVIMMLASLLWMVVMIFSPHYMQGRRYRSRFHWSMAITHSAVLGTLMAGDLLSFFFFFELMTLSSFLLVVQNGTPDAFQAGWRYLYMGVFGGLCLLLGIILLYLNVGSVEFASVVSHLQEMGPLRYLIFCLFIFGFGMKAGMVPLHSWLPGAHTNAPTPSSAILSGMLVKIGGYGMLRILTVFLFPSDEGNLESWEIAHTLGFLVIWLGLISMLFGVFMALQQAHMKRMLAYHSVSQMGYIIMGIGIAVFLGREGSMGFTGAIYHTINHALFKSLLFMVAGSIYIQAGHLNMYKLGGLWKKMPFTALVALIAVCGITGTPGMNGFASKSILHHAIVEAAQQGSSSLFYAEVLFTLVSAGTVCSFIKLFGLVFLGKPSMEIADQPIGNGYRMMDMAMAVFAVAILLIGIFPSFLLDYFLIPTLHDGLFSSLHIHEHIVGMSFFTRKDLMGMVLVWIFGGLIFFIGIRTNLFHLHAPSWMRSDSVFLRPIKAPLRNVSTQVLIADRRRHRNHKHSTAHFDRATQRQAPIRWKEAFTVVVRACSPSVIKGDAELFCFVLLLALIAMLLF